MRRWGIEFLMGFCCLATGVGIFISSRRKRQPLYILAYALLVGAGRFILFRTYPVLSTFLTTLVGLALLLFFYQLLRTPRSRQESPSSEEPLEES